MTQRSQYGIVRVIPERYNGKMSNDKSSCCRGCTEGLDTLYERYEHGEINANELLDPDYLLFLPKMLYRKRKPE